MGKSIQIPGYKVLIPNSTWSKKTEPITRPGTEEKFPATRIMNLMRYTIPTEDKVIDLIQQAARDFNSNPDKYNISGEVSLLEYMKRLPSCEIERIAEGAENSIEHLKEHYPDKNYQSGRVYLQVSNGDMADEVLKKAEGLIKKVGSTIYPYLIIRAGVNDWYLTIRLNEKETLPDRLEMDYLIDRGVKNCDVFRIMGNYGDYQNAANQVRLLYNSLFSSDIVRKINDQSDHFLRSKAALTINETAKCISRGMMSPSLGGLVESLKQGIGVIVDMTNGSDEEESNGFKFNPYDPPPCN